MCLSAQRSTVGRDSKNKRLYIEWRTAVVIVLVTCTVVLGLFWQTIGTMVAVWAHSRTFAHGFLVLPAALYLVWCYRDRLAPVVPVPSRWGLLLLVVAGIAWLIGYLTNTLPAQQTAVITMFPGLIWATLGTAVTRALLFPLGFLVFAVPVGTVVEPWLQNVTAAFVVSGLELAGIPVNWEGNLVTIPSGTWEIARDCGGLRYVLPGLALGYLYAAVIYRHSLRRASFLLVCVVVLIASNGLRAYGIILGDHLGIAEGTDHRVFSYAIYGVTMISLFWLGLRWKESAEEQGRIQRAHDSDRGIPIRKTALTALAAVAILALAPLSAWLLKSSG